MKRLVLVTMCCVSPAAFAQSVPSDADTLVDPNATAYTDAATLRGVYPVIDERFDPQLKTGSGKGHWDRDGQNDQWIKPTRQERFEISQSVFFPRVGLQGTAKGSITDGTLTEDLNESTSGHDRYGGYMVEAQWKVSPRGRLKAGWYKAEGDRRWARHDTEWTNHEYVDEGVTYEGRHYVQAKSRFANEFSLYHLSYGYDLYQGKRSTVTGLVGVYGAKLSSSFGSEGVVGAEVEGVRRDFDVQSYNTYSKRAHAVGLGLQGEWEIGDKWEARAGVSGFRTAWGDFMSQDGHFIHANAQLGYKFTPRYTAFVGYDWFELKLRDEATGQYTYDGQTYTAQGQIEGRLRVHGPVAGVRVTF